MENEIERKIAITFTPIKVSISIRELMDFKKTLELQAMIPASVLMGVEESGRSTASEVLQWIR